MIRINEIFRPAFFISTFIIVSSILSLPGCGKNEAAGGAVGTASGAMLGSLIGDACKAPGTGGIIGACLGHVVGRSIGKAEDDQREEFQKVHEQTCHRQRIAALQQENDELRRHMTQWCALCGREELRTGARRCIECGGQLIREKFCPDCGLTFGHNARYRYCPQCEPAVRLSCR